VGSWTGSEKDAFQLVLTDFEKRTGQSVNYIETRDLRGVIEQRLHDGDQIDLAGVTGPRHLAELARANAIWPLAAAVDLGAYKAQVAPTFVELGSVDERPYGAFIKSSVKGLIWYNTRVYQRGIPGSWAELQRLGDAAAKVPTLTWCVGLASGESSGWPATDWIENILIRQSGPDVYDRWVAGIQPWSSSEVTRAFQTFGQIVADDAVYGGSEGAIATPFSKAGEPLFTDPPGCLFLQQGSFMVPFLAGSTRLAGTDFDFYAFPPIEPAFAGAIVGAGDLLALFSDNPTARQLLQFLISAEGQSRWVATGGGVLSINSSVTEYPSAVDARAAALLIGARQFRFDGSDQMPSTMSNAFLQATIDFTRDQRSLPDILSRLDEVRGSAY
jgi:alpha-glucoside transport system substrate-binding protein